MDAKCNFGFGSGNGIFSRFVEWCMSTWNPYTERELQRMLQNKIQSRQYGINLTSHPLPPFTVADEMESLLDTVVNSIAIPSPKENERLEHNKIDDCSGAIYTNGRFDLASSKTNNSQMCEYLEENNAGASNTYPLLTHETTHFTDESSNGEESFSVINFDFSASDMSLLDSYVDDDLNIVQNSEIWNKLGNFTFNKNASDSKCQYIDVNTSANGDDKDAKSTTTIQNKSQSYLDNSEQKGNSDHEDDENEGKSDEMKRNNPEKEWESDGEEGLSENEGKCPDTNDINDCKSIEIPNNNLCFEDQDIGEINEHINTHGADGTMTDLQTETYLTDVSFTESEHTEEISEILSDGDQMERGVNMTQYTSRLKDDNDMRNERITENSTTLTNVHDTGNIERREGTDDLVDIIVTKSEQTAETTTDGSLTDVVVTMSGQRNKDTSSYTKFVEAHVTNSEESKEKTSSLTDVEVPKNEKEEIDSSLSLAKEKTKSVTWKNSYTSADVLYGSKTSESESSQTPGPSSYSINPAEETSSEDVLTENDLAFGNEGLAHYELFVKIEKNVEIQDINEERQRIRELYKWRVDKINDIMKIAKAYYINPTGKAVEDWKDLKRGMAFERKIKSHTDVKIKLAKLPEFLPFFTIFITLAQLIVCGILCSLGGLTTIGIEPFIDHVVGIQTFLGTETVHRWVIPNLWIGPSDRYMISVGAFFAPCLRDDIELHLLTIQQNYSKTEPLGCCEMSSRNTAATTTQYECQDMTHGVGIWKSTVKCSERLSGSNSVSHNLKPCCYGNRGQCKLTTHQHCVFLEGYYFKHSEEHCSQVNCPSSICSMGGFKQNTHQPWLPDSPAQWWRLPLSLIYHHGIIHVVLVDILHVFLMRIMERSIGWLRIMIVYILSGMAGNLAASIFEPYSPQVGATGSIFGLLGVTIIEILLLWKFIKSPKLELGKVLCVIFIFLFVGTLRYISNFKIITGLLIGLCSGVLVLPYVTFSKISQRSRVVLVALCIPLLLLIYFMLLYIFVKVQTISDCYICKLINCVPYTENMCQEAHEE